MNFGRGKGKLADGFLKWKKKRDDHMLSVHNKHLLNLQFVHFRVHFTKLRDSFTEGLGDLDALLLLLVRQFATFCLRLGTAYVYC